MLLGKESHEVVHENNDKDEAYVEYFNKVEHYQEAEKGGEI